MTSTPKNNVTKSTFNCQSLGRCRLLHNILSQVGEGTRHAVGQVTSCRPWFHNGRCPILLCILLWWRCVFPNFCIKLWASIWERDGDVTVHCPLSIKDKHHRNNTIILMFTNGCYRFKFSLIRWLVFAEPANSTGGVKISAKMSISFS